MSAPGTLLRAPPFPWAKAGAAAIATAYVPVGAIDQARLDALVAQIREARVGGAFWAPPADAAGGTTVDRTAADAPAVDPWSLLRPGVRLETTPGDEWELVALLAGAELRARDPKVLRVRLAEALLGVAYRDPFTGERIEPEAAVAILAGWRRTLDANRAVAAAAGMAWWKREQIARFLWTGRRHPLVLSDDPAGVAAAARRARRCRTC